MNRPQAAAKGAQGGIGEKSMREEVITVVRYSLELRREVLMRLTYSVGEGPRPDTVRWFLIGKEIETLAQNKANS
jgi:hypothetical protein